MKNIFVVGLDPFNLALLQTVHVASQYNFVELLSYEEAVRPRTGRFNLRELFEKVERQLNENWKDDDAIIGYWDFPTTVIVPTLCRRHGLPGPSLEAVARCEHKYWSRIEQSRVVPDLVPQFAPVDPFDDDALATIELPFPFWLKPVKAHSSFLGFRIENESDFREHVQTIRANINRFGDPLNEFLSMVVVPHDVARIDGNYCIAEEMISANHQCTLEGFVWRGQVEIYGVIDSIRGGRYQSSFERYQYPSRIPEQVQERMVQAASRVMRHLGYDNAPFNIEFYWDDSEDRIRLLEINPRISKSHSPLFLMVDGVSHHQVAIDLAVGRRPEMRHRQGISRMAAKFMVRVYDDVSPHGRVTRMPRIDEIDRVQKLFPDAHVRLMAREGTPVAELHFQDSYSVELAEIHLGGDNEEELLAKYDKCLELLPFQIESRTEAA